MIQKPLQLCPWQDRTQDQLRDIHTSSIREEQKCTAGNYFLLKELPMCGTASQVILWRLQVFRHLKEGLRDTGGIKIEYIIMS